MALAKVEVILGNGNIGSQTPSEDGTSALISSGASVVGKITVGVPEVIYSLAEAEALGIEAAGVNAYAHGHITDFYLSAPDGTALYIMLVLATVTMTQMADVDGDYAPVLLDYASGSVKLISFTNVSEAEEYEDGIDVDVPTAVIKAQALCEAYAAQNKPLRFIMDGKWIDDIGILPDFSTFNYNRGSVMIGATTATFNASVGFYMGLLASLPVQRKVSRVKNGAIPFTNAYFTNANPLETHETLLDTLSNKGYVFFRKHVGLGGYYFSGDETATAATDDYSSMARGRVIDKVARIAYARFVQELDEEVDVDADGKMDAGLVKSLQGAIENAVNTNMTNKGELSSFQAIIDPTQNVIADGGYTVQCLATPKGYSKIITIELNYNNPAN